MKLKKEVLVYDSDGCSYEDALNTILTRLEDDFCFKFTNSKQKFIDDYKGLVGAETAEKSFDDTHNFQEELKQYLENNKPDDEDIYDEQHDTNSMHWEYLKNNVLANIELYDIIGIANLERWNGKFSGYKEFQELEDVFFTSADFAKWYVDTDGDLKSELSHHDGTNYVTYRQWRDNIPEETRQKVLADIYYGTNKYNIDNYTKKIGHYFTDLYGITKNGRLVKTA